MLSKKDYNITKELPTIVGSLAFRCGRLLAVTNTSLITMQHFDFRKKHNSSTTLLVMRTAIHLTVWTKCCLLRKRRNNYSPISQKLRTNWSKIAQLNIVCKQLTHNPTLHSR